MRTVNKVYRPGFENAEHEINETVCICGLFEQYHEHKTDCQGVCDIWEKVDGLIQALQLGN